MTVKLTPFPGVSTAVRHFAGTPDWLAVWSRGPVSTARGASVLAPYYSPAFCQNGLRNGLKIIGLLEARWTPQLGFQTLANGVFLGRVGKEFWLDGSASTFTVTRRIRTSCVVVILQPCEVRINLRRFGALPIGPLAAGLQDWRD